MSTVTAILDGVRSIHTLPILKIVETGIADTNEIVSWCQSNPDSSFVSVDLDSIAQDKIHGILEQTEAAAAYSYRTQDHKKFLSELSWIDVAFLSPENLQEGLQEFQLALSAGARLVVMRDYQSKAFLAVQQAKRLQWDVHHSGNYSIMIRPNN
jgi:hypothetical protein